VFGERFVRQMYPTEHIAWTRDPNNIGHDEFDGLPRRERSRRDVNDGPLEDPETSDNFTLRKGSTQIAGVANDAPNETAIDRTSRASSGPTKASHNTAAPRSSGPPNSSDDSPNDPVNGCLDGTPDGTSNDSPPPPNDPPPPPPLAAEPRSKKRHPFTGLLTIENECGLEQSIKTSFSLIIDSNSDDGSILTEITLNEFRLILPSPSNPHRSSSRVPLKEHFRPVSLSLTVSPGCSQELLSCELCGQRPEMNWWKTKIGHSRDTSIGANVGISGPIPTAQIPIAVKFGSATEHIPLLDYINFNKTEINEIRGKRMRMHFWRYPMQANHPVGGRLTLPTHSSEMQYWHPAKLTKLQVCVEVVLEFVASRKLKKNSQNRGTDHAIDLAGAKHVKMQYFLDIEKREEDELIQFRGSGRRTELRHMIDKNQKLPVTSDSQDNPCQAGRGRVLMNLSRSSPSIDEVLTEG
jgi:hypothetical protein